MCGVSRRESIAGPDAGPLSLQSCVQQQCQCRGTGMLTCMKCTPLVPHALDVCLLYVNCILRWVEIFVEVNLRETRSCLHACASHACTFLRVSYDV